MTRLSEDAAFERWMNGQADRGDETGAVARMVRGGLITLTGSDLPTRKRHIRDKARREFNELRRIGDIQLGADGSMRMKGTAIRGRRARPFDVTRTEPVRAQSSSRKPSGLHRGPNVASAGAS